MCFYVKYKMITGTRTTFALDKVVGDVGEKLLLPKLRQFFNDNTIIATESKYGKFCKWDFEGDTGSRFELKTRRNRKNAYPTTLLPIHKVVEGKKQYFIFNYIDKISYIEYNEELFKTFQQQELIDGRYNFYKEPITHLHIPVNLLIDIQ